MSTKIPASHFVDHCVANVNNDKMPDADFRTLVRNTLDITEGAVKDYKVVIEYGICGYHYTDATFRGKSLDDLRDYINTRTGAISQLMEEADEKDGDLRQFSPAYANGHMSLDGIGVEFGDEFLNGSIVSFQIDGNEVGYKATEYTRLRSLTGVS